MALRREVIYDYTFEEQAKLLEPDVERLDSVISSAEWKMSCHAEECEQVPEQFFESYSLIHFPALLPCASSFLLRTKTTVLRIGSNISKMTGIESSKMIYRSRGFRNEANVIRVQRLLNGSKESSPGIED